MCIFAEYFFFIVAGVFALAICMMVFEAPIKSAYKYVPKHDDIYAPLGTTIEVITWTDLLISTKDFNYVFKNICNILPYHLPCMSYVTNTVHNVLLLCISVHSNPESKT